MHQRKIGVFLFVIASLLSFVSRSQDSVSISGGALTLQQCVDIAIKNNLLVRQRDLQMQTTGVNYKQAKDYLLPTVNAQGGYGINFGRSLNQNTYTYSDQQFNSGSYGINAGLNLFNGLQV